MTVAKLLTKDEKPHGDNSSGTHPHLRSRSWKSGTSGGILLSVGSEWRPTRKGDSDDEKPETTNHRRTYSGRIGHGTRTPCKGGSRHNDDHSNSNRHHPSSNKSKLRCNQMDFIRSPAAPAAAQKVSKRAWLGLQLPVLVLRAEPFCPYLFWVLSHPLPGKYYLCTTRLRSQRLSVDSSESVRLTWPYNQL